MRPDANPMRIMLGIVGLASAAAFTTALLPSVIPQPVADATTAGGADAVAPQPSVQHVTRYVTLAPGQTPPPQSVVVAGPQAAPTPKATPAPKPKVVTRTRQSGQP